MSFVEPPPPRLTRDALRTAVGALCAQHPALAAIVARHGPPPLWARPAGFVTLARIVLEQQVSLEAAATLFRRLDRDLPGGFAAPAIAATTVDTLRANGLTRQKAAYIHGLAVSVSTGALDLTALSRLADDEAMARLVALHGIGPWTAAVYLLFALRRPDIWPPGDLALHLALHESHRLRAVPSSVQATAHAQQWAPWRSVAARILWHGYLRDRGR
jgi:DNA-3-methyladenine glycosylase II